MDKSELSLINQVELRIALADTDAKFQSSLDIYLAPLLLKLSSKHGSVRQQVLKFIQNVIPRINSVKDLKLPVLKLLQQAKNPQIPNDADSDSTSVQLYSLLFASKGVDRLDAIERRELIPEVLNDIHKFSGSVGARLFHVFTKLLKDWKSPDRGSDDFKSLKNELSITDKDESFIVDKFEKLFLLVPVINNDGVIPRGYTCPGLSANEVSFLTYDAGVSYKSDDLAAVKINIASFVHLLDDDKIYGLLLIGSVDSTDKVSNSSASLLRKISTPHENEALVNHLISLFIGDKDAPRSPVKPQLQERFLTVLTGSKVATKSSSIPIITSIGLNSSRLPKLKAATIKFIQWVARTNGSALISGDHSVNVAAQLRNNLHSEGWPKFEVVQGTNYASEINHRRLQYEALGDILKYDSSLLKDLSYIEFLFDSLIGDIHEVRSTIQEALGAVVIHLPELPHEIKPALKKMLNNFLQDDDFAHGDNDSVHAVRYAALKFVNAAFPFNDAHARLLNVFGTSTLNRADVIEEAQKGLHPHWFNILTSSNTKEFKPTGELLGEGNNVEFPSFSSLMAELQTAISYTKNKKSSALRTSLSTAVEFILRTLVTESIGNRTTVVVQDAEWILRLEKGLEHDSTVINLVKKHLSTLLNLNEFLEVLLNEFSYNGKDPSISSNANVIFGKIFLRLASLSPSSAIESLVPQIPKLISVIENGHILGDDVIQYAANSIGIIASHPSNSSESINQLFEGFLNSTTAGEQAKEGTYSAWLLTLSYLASRLIYRQNELVLNKGTLNSVYQILVNALKSSDIKKSEAAVCGISELAMFGAFGPELATEEVDGFKREIADSLKLKVKKLDERAIVAFALLSLSEDESISEDLTEYESALYDTHTTKQVETLFTSGEAFTILASGWNSKFLKQKIDIQEVDKPIRVASRIERSNFILTTALKASSNTKPSLRKAGCIWLLSLVQYCSDSSFIIDNSSTIHVTFMRFLADRDELVQEAASRGLSLIYNLGDTDLKEVLVKSLLKSFTDSTLSSKLSSGSVDEDTQLFEPGVLKTDDGSISTYKDILSLASEVGDPSLVYKFMSLAKSSALWSSRKGIAFGLGNILSKSSLDKLLFENTSLSNKLIPKLYRYRYDPNPSVARSMNDIWTTIVQDSSKTIDKYYEQILKELLTSMGNKEWRVREASTVALTDFLQSLPADKYKGKMEEIWTMGFRAIDDIKESVRKAGSGLTRSLSQTLVNSISVESGSSETRAKEVLTQLIPFLLGNKGILSDSEDVRNFALETILNLVKKSGKAIRPFISELIDQFILLMSTLEPQIINYLALNADKYKLKHDDIDAKRLQSIGSSPMMNALEKLIDLIDDTIIEEVINKLQSTVKKSVGLPSKAAASRVIVTLVVRHLQLIKPYGDQLLAICTSQLKDRNNTVSSSFATAAGYVCRVCSIESVVKYSSKIQRIYFESEDDKVRMVSSIASEAVSKYSGDRFASVAAAFLPLSFIGKNDPAKEVSEPFNNEWSENTSGNGAIKLYIHEICDLVKENINSQQFFIRQVAAKSIAKACNAIDSSSISEKVSTEIFDVLINASQGRSWAGKEDVLAALVSLSINSKKYVNDRQELLAKVNKIVITEAKRRNKEYQKHAIISLCAFLNEFPNVELYDSTIEIFDGRLSDDYYESEDEDEDEETKKKGEKTVNQKSTKKNLTREAERISAISSLTTCFQLYPDGTYHIDLLKFILQSLTNTFKPVVYIPTWRSQIAVVDGISRISKILAKASNIDDAVIDLLIGLYNTVIRENTKESDVENVKIQTVRAGKALIDIKTDRLVDFVKTELTGYKEREKSTIVLVDITNALKST
jgi:proteasome component ECM29